MVKLFHARSQVEFKVQPLHDKGGAKLSENTITHPNKEHPKINVRILPGCDRQLAQVSTQEHYN
ncbi:MAG: hypothetical protein WCP96_04790 [Methylococcaceae bacterium]